MTNDECQMTKGGPVRTVGRILPSRKWRVALAAGLLVAIAPLFARLALPLVPLPQALFADQVPQLEVLDRNGQSLRVARPGSGPFNRRVAYSEIPQPLVEATLAAEDRRFRQHHGVDWRATFRAACQYIIHRRVISGGSTVTQQLIKVAEPRPRTFRTKFIEAVQAMRLEQLWDKERIVCEYLNRLEYGNFNTGCAAAAQFYFGKPLRDLSAAECALLAALPQAPSRLNPVAHFDRARKRQQWILARMAAGGSLTAEEFERARAEELRLARPQRAFEAPHFVDLVLQQRAEDRGQRSEVRNQKLEFRSQTAHAALVIRTALDLELNHFAERTVRQHLAHLREQEARNAAVVVIDNRSGEVLALVGSENYFAPRSGQVNGAWAARSAGSAFKPFTYLLAFERGATPASIVADVPTDFATATGLFSPVNYNRRCYGPMRYRLALANSLNISAVKVLASIGGSAPLCERLKSCGLTTLTRSAEDYGLGLTIGNAEARLLELANAYACLARLGEYRPYRLLLDGIGARPSSVAAAHDWSARKTLLTSAESSDIAATENGRVPKDWRSGSRSVADPGAAYLIADILSDNDARTLAFGAETPLRFDFPVACKTGTSSDFRDNWAFGYTPEFTVGVWVGNFDGGPMEHVSGISGAGPILHDLFEHLHNYFGTSWYSPPKDIVECSIHPLTGHRLRGLTSTPGITEKFLASYLPLLEAPEDYEPVSSRITDHGSRPVRLNAEYREWYASADNWLLEHAACPAAETALRITFPLPGTVFYLDPDLPHGGRQLRLQAEGPQNLRWQSETLQLEHDGIRPIALLAEGRHQIVVSDPKNGQQAQTWIQVVAR
jgi:penicillin-binding protein 1C